MTKDWTNDWIEVFKTGEHTDSAGNTRQWTEQDIDNIIAKYDTQSHEAPVVIGHPKENHPAYGWVESIKREGDKLKVKLKKVLPEFKNWVDKGLYRKISVALSPETGLRHIGFLGAVAPAIKGLSHAFCDKPLDTIDNTITNFKTTLKGDNMQKPASNEFTQEIEMKDAQIKTLIEQAKKQELYEFAQTLNTQGKIPSAYKQIVIDVLHSIKESNNCFSDSNHKNQTLQGFKHFLNSLPQVCEFSELATTENVAPGTMRLPEEDLGVRMANSLNK